MTVKRSLYLIFLWVTWMLMHPGCGLRAADSFSDDLPVTADFSYRIGPRDTPELARALALFGAKFAVVEQSADQLAKRGLLKSYADRQMEIYCLTAGQAAYSLIDASIDEKSGVLTIKISSRVTLADFVRAEIRNAALEEEELHFSWQEEMEPIVPPAILPAEELSRAYRYIRHHHWRKAIIYLDHLETKYPDWGDLFFAKGVGFEQMHEPVQAREAFSKACERGHPAACERIDTAGQSN